jgi:hypothetical protein
MMVIRYLIVSILVIILITSITIISMIVIINMIITIIMIKHGYYSLLEYLFDGVTI